jgi:hypothetical protein
MRGVGAKQELTEREKCGFEAIVSSGRDGPLDVPNSISSAGLFEPRRFLAYHSTVRKAFLEAGLLRKGIRRQSA